MKRIIYTLACLMLSVGAWAQNVAKIGETEYATLADAITAVPTDGTETTITMLADVDLAAALTIANTKNVVIDLNGKTVKNDASKSLAQLVTVNGKLTINDSSEPSTGVIKNTASAKYVIKTGTAASVLTLNNGTIETTTGNSNGAVYGTNGSFVMTGGKIIAAGTGVTSKNVTISGGEIIATAGQALCAAGTITGGTFTSTNNNAVYANQSGTLAITGGTFTGVSSKPTINIYSTDVEVTGATLNNGVGFASNATAMLLPGTDNAYLTNTQAEFYDGATLVGYAPINTGLFANNKVAGKTVKLTKDVATTTYLNISKSFTLDLNGHNIACTPAKADATILTKGTASAPVELTIKGEGQISCADHGEGCNAIQVSNYSTVNIEGGNYSVPGDNATIYIVSSVATNPTTVNITGGSYHSGDGKWILNIKDDAATAGAKINVTGGKFYNFDPANNTVDGNSDGNGTNYVPDNYVTSFTMDGSDKVYEVSEGTWVAKIEGGVGSQFRFATLAEAISAVPDGVETTITLLANTTENITIPAGKNITIDLNGKTLSGGSVASNGKKAAILNYGSVVIKDSSVEQTGTIKRDDPENYDQNNSYYVIDNQGTMTIKSGTITNNAGLTTSHKGSSLIRNGEVAEGAVLNIEGGTLTQKNFDVIKNGGKNSVLNITGGTIESENSYAILSYDKVNMSAGSVTGKVCLRSYDSDYAVANISGGTINGNITVETYPGNTPVKHSECNISGTAVINGTLSIGEGNGNTFTANDENGTIAVSGGIFANPVPEKYCADGFIPTDDGEGHYGVKNGSYVAQIGDVKYETLSAAVAVVAEGQTITLIADVNEAVANSNTNSFTIDLNDKNWISSGDAFKNNGGTVTFTGDGLVKSTAADGVAVWARLGSVIINGGNYENCSNEEATVYVGTTNEKLGDNKPTATINGGTFKNTADGVYKYATSLLPLTLNVHNDISDADAYQAIVINGGKFFGNDPSIGDDKQMGKINNNSIFVAPNLHAEKVNGVFEIKPGGYVAQLGYLKYVKLDDAIDARPEMETTIYLLDNAETKKDELPANITIDARNNVLTMPSFVVLDGEAFTLPKITGAETYKVKKATYKRTNISATEWGTVILPFSLTSGNGATYYTFNNISGSTLTVDETTTVVAPNTPVVFQKAKGGDLEINQIDAIVSLDKNPSLASGALVGTYTARNVTANGSIYFINGDTFHKAQVSVKVPMYRAYIDNSSSSGAKPSVLSIMVADNTATSIEALDADATVSAIYDASGRKISAPQKGMNIMKLANGKTIKVMMK